MLHKHILGAAFATAVIATSASATLPMPSEAAAPREANAYLFKAGAGDIFEIVTSQKALQKSANPAIRDFATMLIAHHTDLTTTTLATAKSAGVMPPPPELSPMQKQMVAELDAAPAAEFDRVFLRQQLAAHQQALALVTGYSAQGDVPALRGAATSAVPVVRSHIADIQRMSASMR